MKHFLLIVLLLSPALVLADAGDLSEQLKEAGESIKQWGTDAMLALVIATVGFAIVTKWYCPRWLERARNHSLEAIGSAVFLYIIFYFFGDTIKDAFKENLNFWNWFGL